MVIQKKRASKKSAVKASNSRAKARRRAIRANEEMEEKVKEGGAVDVTPEASDLLFEVDDVAELLAEVTGEDVSVEADEDQVIFGIGDDEYTVDAEGDEEILENTRKPLRGKASVRASRKVNRAPRRAARR